LSSSPSASPPLGGTRHRNGILALLLVTAVWGTTFPAMKAMSGDLQALEIISLRFAVACAVLWPFLRGVQAHELRWGLLMGTVMFVATALQVSGLGLTSSNRNAFITGLNVVIVPCWPPAWGSAWAGRCWWARHSAWSACTGCSTKPHRGAWATH